MFHYLVNDKSGSIGNKCLGGNVFQSIFKTWAPTATCTDCLYCKDEPDCLAKIERLTLYPNDGCKSLADELFAVKTNETLTLRCPGYSGIQKKTRRIWTADTRILAPDITNLDSGVCCTGAGLR
ncbi:PREDICTED: thymic stromal lymphopoietin isoform X3 [Hipposideros armiger]|uniref:Thymic stromal lymphopoietin isoform X3 n=1 Tax=Hipposideros armiger TaxID=186990 RepID=A0A8B7QMJ4_HIPAR|nr:PREDICTED: thymic stromal lymphopoietin isoform X3 [Hipposideros armiger]